MRCPECGRAMFKRRDGVGAFSWEEFECPECGYVTT